MNINPILLWITANNTLLILVWNGASVHHDHNLRTPLIFFGVMVKEGISYDAQIDHYATLGLLLDMHGLAGIGNAKSAPPIEGVWK